MFVLTLFGLYNRDRVPAEKELIRHFWQFLSAFIQLMNPEKYFYFCPLHHIFTMAFSGGYTAYNSVFASIFFFVLPPADTGTIIMTLAVKGYMQTEENIILNFA